MLIAGAGCALSTEDIFENVELYDASYGIIYELDNLDAVDDSEDPYGDLDLNIGLIAGGTHTFVLRADTLATIANFDTCTITPSMTVAESVGPEGDGVMRIVETEDDTVVTDITPSSLTWKKLEGSEAGATVAITPIANTSVVRGMKGETALKFTIKADAS